MRTIKLSQATWLTIYNDIAKHHPPSVLLVRSKMRKVLGCTSRTHIEWHEGPTFGLGEFHQVEQIHLDFFSENKYTMFILKYSELIKEPV